MPETSSSSSSEAKLPSRRRSSTMRAAIARPIPGTAASSGALEALTSTLPAGGGEAECRRGRRATERAGPSPAAGTRISSPAPARGEVAAAGLRDRSETAGQRDGLGVAVARLEMIDAGALHGARYVNDEFVRPGQRTRVGRLGGPRRCSGRRSGLESGPFDRVPECEGGEDEHRRDDDVSCDHGALSRPPAPAKRVAE